MVGLRRRGSPGPVLLISLPYLRLQWMRSAHLYVLDRRIIAAFSLRAISLGRIAIRRDPEQCLSS